MPLGNSNKRIITDYNGRKMLNTRFIKPEKDVMDIDAKYPRLKTKKSRKRCNNCGKYIKDHKYCSKRCRWAYNKRKNYTSIKVKEYYA